MNVVFPRGECKKLLLMHMGYVLKFNTGTFPFDEIKNSMAETAHKKKEDGSCIVFPYEISKSLLSATRSYCCRPWPDRLLYVARSSGCACPKSSLSVSEMFGWSAPRAGAGGAAAGLPGGLAGGVRPSTRASCLLYLCGAEEKNINK
jgi:hypothetical protein